MCMSGCPCLTRRRFRRDPTDALFADQSQSIVDNFVAFVEAQPSTELALALEAIRTMSNPAKARGSGAVPLLAFEQLHSDLSPTSSPCILSELR